jgi:hypothetical protein
MAQPADINDFIVRQGTPCKLPGPWGVFKCDPAFFNLEVAPGTLLRRLRSEFESDDLNRAHVTKGKGKRAIILSPPLADNRSFIVAVRPKAEEKPRALSFAGMETTLEGRWTRRWRTTMCGRCWSASAGSCSSSVRPRIWRC